MSNRAQAAYRPYEVFISYAQVDRDTAAALAAELRRRGRLVFLDVDSLSPGDNFSSTITRAISAASVVVVLISPQYSSSRWAKGELELALEQAEAGQLLVPVWLSGLKPSELPRRLWQYRGVVISRTEDIAAAAMDIDRAVAQNSRPSDSDQQRSASLLAQTLTDSIRLLGPDHPSTLSTRANLANVYLQRGELDLATALLEQTLTDSIRLLGPDHPSTLSTRANLANVYLQRSELDLATVLLEQTTTDSIRVLGPDHPSTLSTRANLANVYLQRGELDLARALLEQTLNDSIRVLGPGHSLTMAISRLAERARNSQ